MPSRYEGVDRAITGFALTAEAYGIAKNEPLVHLPALFILLASIGIFGPNLKRYAPLLSAVIIVGGYLNNDTFGTSMGIIILATSLTSLSLAR